MKESTPKFGTKGDRKNPRLFLLCSQCSEEIRELKDDDTIDVRRGYYCKGCDDGVIRLNQPEQD